jgi:hypothetical protein
MLLHRENPWSDLSGRPTCQTLSVPSAGRERFGHVIINARQVPSTLALRRKEDALMPLGHGAAACRWPAQTCGIDIVIDARRYNNGR